MQVIYIFRSADQIDYETMDLEDIIDPSEPDVPLIYVIHARDLTPDEKSRYKRRS